MLVFLGNIHRKEILIKNKICKKILLTGGTCAGKTDSLPFIKEYFSKQGYDVYIVNEIATMLILGGITAPKVGESNFQELLIKMQLETEKIYERAIELSINNKNLIIYDRGPIDAMMYLDRTELEKILNKFNTTYDRVLNNYDGIIHMETVAKGLPELYTFNNKARRDEGNDTINIDNKILEAYKTHPKRFIINSCEDFKDKIKKLIEKMEEIL